MNQNKMHPPTPRISKEETEKLLHKESTRENYHSGDLESNTTTQEILLSSELEDFRPRPTWSTYIYLFLLFVLVLIIIRFLTHPELLQDIKRFFHDTLGTKQQ
jgi:hypothetical protein